MADKARESWYEKHTPQMTEKWSRFASAVFEGELDPKTRELIALASSAVLRCGHCTKAHIGQAKKAGASKEDVAEALMVAALISSGTQLFWMIDDYEEMLGGGKKATPWFIEQTGSMGRQWKSFHDAVHEAGALDRKTKELIATAVGSLGRCRHCTRTHVEQAIEHGASKMEVTEALMVASFFGATTQLMWMSEEYQELLG